MIQTLKGSNDGIKGNFLGNGMWTFFNQFGNLVLSFGIMVLMRNWLGEEDAGTFVAGFSYAFLLSHIAIFGFDNLSIREIAKFVSSKKVHQLSIYHKFSNNFVWFFSTLVMIGAGLYFYNSPDQNSYYYLFALPLIPFMTMLMLNQYKILGMGYVVHSQTPEKLIRPGVLFASLPIAHWFVPQYETLIFVLLVNVLAYIIVWLISDINFRSKLKQFQHQHQHQSTTSQGKISRRRWFYAAGGLFVYSVIGHLNGKVDIIMLDHMTLNNESITFYNSAHRFGGFVAFGALIVNQILGPIISKELNNKEYKKLKKVIAQSSLFSFLIALSLLLVFLFFGDWILHYFFDRSVPEEFEVLKITSWGYLIQVLAGSAAFLLIMESKTSKFATISIAIGLLVNILANLVLIPDLGIVGAAIGTTLSLICWTTLMVYFAIRFTKVNPTFISKSLLS